MSCSERSPSVFDVDSSLCVLEAKNYPLLGVPFPSSPTSPFFHYHVSVGAYMLIAFVTLQLPLLDDCEQVIVDSHCLLNLVEGLSV